MTQVKVAIPNKHLSIKWEKLPDDFILPEDPGENNLQPLLASALRESLELANLILESMLIASNFGLCATVEGETIVKATDWVYVPKVKPLGEDIIRRSYTPKLQGDNPSIVMEFISETEGGEYSINPHYPYGKWYFYEQILQVPVYVIFHPKTGELDVFRLQEGRYVLQKPTQNSRYWIEEIGLFLGVWKGEKSQIFAHWLRWWDQDDNLLLWGVELLEQERQKLQLEKQRAEQEKQRAEQAELQLKQETIAKNKLIAKLQEMGIDPEL
jgi:Uma2 family endonuclease